MVERVSGTIPQFMINQAPADVKEMFDSRGRVKSELVAPERQSRVSRLMLLPVNIYIYIYCVSFLFACVVLVC
jgi:hypothetical protein